MTDYPLSLRTREQLLDDFDGRTPPQEKMLNLIHSIWETFSGGGGGAVDSVNGQTGEVVLDAEDVGALPDTYVPAWDDVSGKPSTFPPTIPNPVILDDDATVANTVVSGTRYYCTAATDIEVTLAAGAPVGRSLHFFRLGEGAVEIVADSGDTLYFVAGAQAVIASQYAAVSAEKIDATSWLIYGALADA